MKFCGRSASISLLGQPAAIRSSVCVSHALGSTSLSRAVASNDAIVAQVAPPASDPANKVFFRVMQIGRIARSTLLLSSSTRPSSRKRRNSVLRESEYRIASAIFDLPEICVSSLSHRAMSSSTIGADARRRASRRVCGSLPLTCASTAHRSATRSTVQVAICDTPWT